ncbi:MAG TPA: hypothetical protein VI916_15470 [Acidimicrobiia bacterium]|nr:hypothetical protein [Acidimicrobiia bacterium]
MTRRAQRFAVDLPRAVAYRVNMVTRREGGDRDAGAPMLPFR